MNLARSICVGLPLVGGPGRALENRPNGSGPTLN